MNSIQLAQFVSPQDTSPISVLRAVGRSFAIGIDSWLGHNQFSVQGPDIDDNDDVSIMDPDAHSLSFCCMAGASPDAQTHIIVEQSISHS